MSEFVVTMFMAMVGSIVANMAMNLLPPGFKVFISYTVLILTGAIAAIIFQPTHGWSEYLFHHSLSALAGVVASYVLIALLKLRSK